MTSRGQRLTFGTVLRPQVSRESIANRMSAANLACVFGINLVRPRHGPAALGALTAINVFTEILIEHFHSVFARTIPPPV